MEKGKEGKRGGGQAIDGGMGGISEADPKNSVEKDANAPCAFCRPHQAPNPRTIPHVRLP